MLYNAKRTNRAEGGGVQKLSIGKLENDLLHPRHNVTQHVMRPVLNLLSPPRSVMANLATPFMGQNILSKQPVAFC